MESYIGVVWACWPDVVMDIAGNGSIALGAVLMIVQCVFRVAGFILATLGSPGAAF